MNKPVRDYVWGKLYTWMWGQAANQACGWVINQTHCVRCDNPIYRHTKEQVRSIMRMRKLYE